jgi:hypothetical protein
MLVAIELLTRERTSDAFIESEDFVLTKLSTLNPDITSVSGLPLDVRRHVVRLTLYYNSLGQLLSFKIVDSNLLTSTIGFRARQTWRVLEPYILAERATRGETETYLSSFEHLVYVVTNKPMTRAIRKLGLRRFDGYPAEVKLANPVVAPIRTTS